MKMKNLYVVSLLAACLAACGGKDPESVRDENGGATTEVVETTSEEIVVTAEELEGNPFTQEWGTPFGIPSFESIKDSHFMPAFKGAILELREEIATIADNPEPPTFDNTILALEMSGGQMSKVLGVFFNLVSMEMNDEKRKLQAVISPMYTREIDAITLNEALWRRVETVYQQRDSLELGEQEARLLELTHRNFVRAGAALDAETKAKVAAINSEMSELTTQFAQNLLRATKSFKIHITDEADMAGLTDNFKASIWDEDKQAWVVTLDRSVYETFMTQSQNRDLRERAFNGYRLRATEGDTDNGPLAIKVAQLRAKRAALLGYDNHAQYILEYNMARTPAGAEEFLLKVWEPGLARAKEERSDMQAMIDGEFTFAGHDWWYYSEKVRANRFNLKQEEIKPYFDLKAVKAGAFEMANRLFGLKFIETEAPLWNDKVTAYEVTEADGDHLGVFYFDMYARDSKRGGAWMNSFRSGSNIDGESVRPIVVNNLNLTAPPQGQPTLLNFSEVETLFHEFGHGLHGLMTKIDYTTFSGVDGPRDYTEFPAQILEHWTSQPIMLGLYAKHYETGLVIPEALVERMMLAANHNQGFATTEFIAAALLDLRWHMLSEEEAMAITDARAFERQVLRGYGLIDEIEPRYRTQYFSHIFSSNTGYSAGYYAYLWSEILDADGFNAFREAEDIFDPEVAGRLKKWVYEAGGLMEADELYRKFRGSDPDIAPLLRGRGFAVPTETEE